MTGGEWPDACERQMTAKVETRAAAPSLSLRLLQGQGGDFDFEPSAAASVRAVPFPRGPLLLNLNHSFEARSVVTEAAPSPQLGAGN
jgi:hypothetical protein